MAQGRSSTIGSFGRLCAPYLVATAPLLVVAVRQAVGGGGPGASSGDLAVLELATRSAARGHQLLGPYSRYGWDHLGPVAFYLMVPVYWLGGRSPEALGLAAALLNAAFVGGLVAVIDRTGDRRRTWWAVGAIWLFFAIFGFRLAADSWNPSLVVFPTALCLLSAAALLSRFKWAVPVLVFAASFCVQTHIGTSLTVGAISLLAIALTAWRARREGQDLRAWKRCLVISAVVAAVLWMLPLYEQVSSGTRGNVGRVVHSLATDDSRAHGLSQTGRSVIALLSPFASDLGWQLRTTGPEQPLVPVTLVADALAASALVTAVTAGTWVARRRGDQFSFWLGVVALAGIATTVVAAASAADVLYGYLLMYGGGVALTCWIALACSLSSVSSEVVVDRPRHVPLAAVGTVLFAAAGALLLLRADHAPLMSSVENARAATHTVESVVPIVARRLTAAPKGPVKVVIENHDQWPVAAGLVVELEEHGWHVGVAGDWKFMFGDQRRATRRPAATVVLAIPGDPAPPKSSEVFRSPGTVVYQSD